MNKELVKKYMFEGLNNLITKEKVLSIKDVGIDNVIDKLEYIFGTQWTYEITKEDIININNEYQMILTIALHTPIKSIAGTSVMVFKDEDSRKINIQKALVDAFKNTINITSIMKIEEKIDLNIDENIDENIDMSSCEESLNAISTSELYELEEEINNNNNSSLIRKDQIEFLNNFKEKHNINTDKKFNYYVKVWADTTPYDIKDKRDLASSLASVIDEFIKWVQDIVIDRIEKREIVSPI